LSMEIDVYVFMVVVLAAVDVIQTLVLVDGGVAPIMTKRLASLRPAGAECRCAAFRRISGAGSWAWAPENQKWTG
jgi:hypothetical protein